jgi:hypothetical protein
LRNWTMLWTKHTEVTSKNFICLTFLFHIYTYMSIYIHTHTHTHIYSHTINCTVFLVMSFKEITRYGCSLYLPLFIIPRFSGFPECRLPHIISFQLEELSKTLLSCWWLSLSYLNFGGCFSLVWSSQLFFLKALSRCLSQVSLVP